MNPQEKAKDIVNRFNYLYIKELKKHVIFQAIDESKRCAIITVQEILNSNPHSNPFNTELHSTCPYWEQVIEEIKKL